MARVVFCYFAMEVADYTPTDIGYIIAQMKQEGRFSFEYAIQRLTYGHSGKSSPGERLEERQIVVDYDARSILQWKPDAVFIFVDSVIWSKFFALGRACAIAEAIRRTAPNVFLGICSYKIEHAHGKSIVDSDIFDCVVSGNVEGAFSDFQKLVSYAAPGVQYKSGKFREIAAPASSVSAPTSHHAKDSLDHIPSPYLTGVFDRFLRTEQLKRNGHFRSFISSSRGCQFSCYYCSRSVKYEKVRYFSPKRFYDEIEYITGKFGVRRYFVLDDALLLSKAHIRDLVQEYDDRRLRFPALEGVELFVMARPESIDREAIEALAHLRVKNLQIGLQTINPDLQHYMGRRIDVEKFREIKGWLDANRIRLYIDIILGLPNDTVEWMKETVKYGTSLNPYSIQLKQLYQNAFTLFHVKQADFGISADSQREIFNSDFEAAYVIKAAGLTDEYYEQSVQFIMETIESRPDIYWKFLSHRKQHVSDNFYYMPSRSAAE